MTDHQIYQIAKLLTGDPDIFESYESLEDNDEFEDNEYEFDEFVPCIECDSECFTTCDACASPLCDNCGYYSDQDHLCSQCVRNDEELLESYEGLEDNDEFQDGCIYCGIGPDQDTIVTFGGEEVCVTCMRDRPMYEWIRNDAEMAKQLLKEEIEEELKHEYVVDNITFNQPERQRDINNAIIANFTVVAKSDYYRNPRTTAKILAARIKAAHIASAAAR